VFPVIDVSLQHCSWWFGYLLWGKQVKTKCTIVSQLM